MDGPAEIEKSTPSLARLAVHTITTKPWNLAQAVQQYASRGIGGVSVWVESLEGIQPAAARKMVDDAGLKVPALVRGGFFSAHDAAERCERIRHNRKLIETAAVLDAEMIVLVVGATPGVPLDQQRSWVRDGIEAILPDASAAGVKLAVEPLHPMYAADKSCINRIVEARALCDAIDDESVGVAVDVYHVWWDPDLAQEIRFLGQSNRIFGFHLCDWRVPTRDLLNDRAIMGEGCIDIPGIRHLVEDAGFDGWNEVEIFSTEYWCGDQNAYLDRIVQSYGTRC